LYDSYNKYNISVCPSVIQITQELFKWGIYKLLSLSMWTTNIVSQSYNSWLE